MARGRRTFSQDPFPAHPDLLALERPVNPRTAVGPASAEVSLADQDPELLVLDMPSGGRS